jgi:hypothetical protein
MRESDFDTLLLIKVRKDKKVKKNLGKIRYLE